MKAVTGDKGHEAPASPLEIVTVVVRHVRPVLGWRTGLFVGRWIVRLPHYRKRFIRPDEDGDLLEIKRSLFPLAALYHELARELGEARALAVTQGLTLDVAVRLQRRWYLTSPAERGWDAFHRGHERQMRTGLLRRNEHTLPVVTPDRVEFRITRCCLYEAMCAMGVGPLTQAFCRSDEVVFNEYLPGMRFHRDDAESNTIARGAKDCGFIFERARSAVSVPDGPGGGRRRGAVMSRADTEILIVGGYGEVGRRLAAILARAHADSVVVAGRNPERASGLPARRIDVDDEASIEDALRGVGLVVACVRQREPHLLRAAVRHGIAYTSIAPPRIDASGLEPLRAEAKRTGARIVLGAGIEPGISNVLARVGADRVGKVDAVETALLLGVGDAYGADSMAFILDEIGQRYTVLVEGRSTPTYAFERSTLVAFPAPIGTRRAYTMPFSDQPYYPTTLGAHTSVARLALDPPWLGGFVAAVTRLGARRWIRGGGAGALRALVERLRRQVADRDRFALRVEVRGGGRVVRSTLLGQGQAQATAAAAAAIAEALYAREVEKPGVWLAEQVIAPPAFFQRLAVHGLVPVTAGPERADR